jgi:SET domain-containing protein
MIRLTPPTKIEIRPTETMGFGVFANRLIRLGEVLEDTPLIYLPIDKSGPNLLPDYRFSYPARQDDWEYMCLASGMGSYYNHSDNPNVIWNDHPTQNGVFRFTALRDIQMGEQCFIYYGNVEFP